MDDSSKKDPSNNDPSQEEGGVSDASRRQMLSAAVKFSGIMAGLGLSAQTFLTSTEAKAADEECIGGIDPALLEGPGIPGVEVDGAALSSLMQMAMQKGSMKPAIQKWGDATGLPAERLQALLQISDDDLVALSVVRQQLKSSLNGIAVAAPWTVTEHATYRVKD